MNGERERKVEEEKREPVGKAKDFDFQIPVVYVIFILTIEVASITTTSN